MTSWKHALGFARLSFLPDYEVREEGGELVLYVGGEPLPAAGADGRRLLLRETAGYRRLTGGPEVMCRDARARLALHLAVGGRPLVRGEEEWARAGWSCDIGEPEGLAYKIGVFERVAREDGRRVESPYADASALGVPSPREFGCAQGRGNRSSGGCTRRP